MATVKAKDTNKRKSKAEILKERRKLRGDLGSMRNVMQVPEVPDHEFRWVNDELRSGKNRVAQLERLGWAVWDGEHVEVADPNNVTEGNLSLGDGGRVAVGTTERGESLQAVLMYIHSDIYHADQAIKEEAIAAKEAGVFSQGNETGMYGGVSIGKT